MAITVGMIMILLYGAGKEPGRVGFLIITLIDSIFIRVISSDFHMLSTIV